LRFLLKFFGLVFFSFFSTRLLLSIFFPSVKEVFFFSRFFRHMYSLFFFKLNLFFFRSYNRFFIYLNLVLTFFLKKFLSVISFFSFFFDHFFLHALVQSNMTDLSSTLRKNISSTVYFLKAYNKK
jgi:hypothetical protein